MTDLAGALCRGQWNLFDSLDYNDHLIARQVCHQCPAFAACLQLLEAQKHAPQYEYSRPTGTWAGQLFGSSQSRFKAKPRECGSDRGYFQHRYNGEEACSMCRKAHVAANRKVSA